MPEVEYRLFLSGRKPEISDRSLNVEETSFNEECTAELGPNTLSFQLVHTAKSRCKLIISAVMDTSRKIHSHTIII